MSRSQANKRLFCRVRYFAKISYKGTNYSGWQIQSNANTVQAELNKAISTLLKSDTDTMGAGRTDAGVHGLGMVAHFDTEEALTISDFLHSLNSILPTDIAVQWIRRVRDEAHARFDCSNRAYEYRIHAEKNPFVNRDSYFFNAELDINRINQAIVLIRSTEDFEAFSKVHTEVNHFNCRIFDASWERLAAGHVFRIRADRFLRGMVRTIMGTLLDIGRQRTSLEELKNILDSKDRTKAGRAVPAHGLYFVEAAYPEEIFEIDG